MAQKSDFVKIGSILNDKLKQYNYCVAAVTSAGKPGKNDKTYREYRLQLINKTNDTSDKLIVVLKDIIVSIFNIKSADITFNSVSPNSSKFPSYSFKFDGQKYDFVIRSRFDLALNSVIDFTKLKKGKVYVSKDTEDLKNTNSLT